MSNNTSMSSNIRNCPIIHPILYQIFSGQPDVYWSYGSLSTLSGSRRFRLIRQTEMIVGSSDFQLH